MRKIKLGDNADNRPMFLTPEMRQTTHMHVIGGSGTGKSKFLESLIRNDIREGHGLCLVDWHGTLYEDVVRYCAQLDVGVGDDFRRLILLNPSRPDYVVGFNPFMNQGVDISTQVSRRIDATIRAWGVTDTNATPTLERIFRLLYTFAVEQRETLPNAAQLLQFEKPGLRKFAMQKISDPYIKQQWQQLLQITNVRDWREFVLSTENRLGRFLSSTTIKRFMGLTEGNINLIDEMNRGSIILINLGSSGFLDRGAARVFASLLLNEFFESAMLRAAGTRHGERPKPFSLFLDEFQEYITGDIGSMLDQVRKGGLHIVLAHQHLGHLADDERLLQSILTNARIRAVFGGLSYDDACLLANEMFLPDLNERQIKKAYHHTVHVYEEQTRIIRNRSIGSGTSHSESWSESEGFGEQESHGRAFGRAAGHGATSSWGSGSVATAAQSLGMAQVGDTEGWFTESDGTSQYTSQSLCESNSESLSESQSDGVSKSHSHSTSKGGGRSISESQSEGETAVPVWVPIPVQELSSEAEWTREEKLSKVAEMLKMQQQRHCFIKTDTDKTQPLLVPFVKEFPISQERLGAYEREVHEEQHALEGAVVDRLLQDNQQRFLIAATSHAEVNITDINGSMGTEQEPEPARQRARLELFAKIKSPAPPVLP